MMKRSCLLFFFVMCVTLAQAQEKLTLQKCVETGIANNLDVLQSDLQTQRDEVNLKQAKLNRWPRLNASGNHGMNEGRSIDPATNSYINERVTVGSYGINSDVVLFNGFTLQNSVKQNKYAYEASKMDWQQAKDNLTINIILAYLQVLNSAELLVQSENQADLSGKQVERLNELNKEGAIKPSDLSDLKGQYATDQLSIINSKNTLETAKISLCQLLNIPYSKDLELEKIDMGTAAPKYNDGPDKIYETALQQLALIKAVDLRKQSAEKAVKVAKGQLWPTLSFGASASTAYSSVALQNHRINTTYVPSTDSVFVNSTTKYPVYKFQDNFSPLTKIGYKDQLDNNVYTQYGFTLNIPIFNNLLQRNRVKQAKITLQNRQLVAKTTRTQLNQSINQAYINMSSASERYTAIVDQVNAFSESFRAAEIRFSEGVFNSVEYLTVKNSIDRANINLINAKYDYALRIKILDYYEGKPLW